MQAFPDICLLLPLDWLKNSSKKFSYFCASLVGLVSTWMMSCDSRTKEMRFIPKRAVLISSIQCLIIPAVFSPSVTYLSCFNGIKFSITHCTFCHKNESKFMLYLYIMGGIGMHFYISARCPNITN